MAPRRGGNAWGSAADVETLYSTYFDSIRQLCRAHLRDDALADDAAQEAFKRTLERRDAVGFHRHPRRFLFGEARRICSELRERREHEMVALRVLLQEGDDPAVVVSETVELSEHVAQLTEPQKKVLAHIFAGYEVKEIAERVGWPYGTVASRLGRLRDSARRRHDQLGAAALWWLNRRRWRGSGAFGPHGITVGVVAAAVLFTATSASQSGSMPPSSPSPRSPVDTALFVPAAGPELAASAEDARLPGEPFTDLRSSAARPPATSASSGLLPLLPPETPEDTHVTAMAASPSYERDHTLVALGLGHTCGCTVLMRSRDGGASWETTLTAAAGAQIVLPPHYPLDGRIFIGQVPGATTPDWVTAGWGQPFTPLALPPGWLATAGSRLLSASATAVWSLNNGVVAPVISYQGIGLAAVASTGESAYILAPAHALTTTGALTTGPSLLTCTQAGCQLAGPVPLPAVGVLTARGSTVVASGAGRVVVSQDGGQTFDDVTPAGPAVDAQALGVGTTALWSVVRTSPATVMRRGASWQVVARGAIQSLVVVSDQRVIALLAGGGLLCSANGGTTWTPRCSVDAGP